MPGLPVCSEHLLRGVDVLAAAGAGVAGAPLRLVAVVSDHFLVVKFSFGSQTQTGDCSRKSSVFILFQSVDEDRITQMRKFRPGGKGKQSQSLATFNLIWRNIFVIVWFNRV